MEPIAQTQPPGGIAFCLNNDDSSIENHVIEINSDAENPAPLENPQHSAPAVERPPIHRASSPVADPETSSCFHRCATISYIAQFVLAAGATFSPSFNAEFSYTTVALAVVNSVVWCCHLFNPARGRYFNNGIHNTVQFVGLGTSIAMAAVKTSSSFFDIYSACTTGLFGGHLIISRGHKSNL